MAFSVGGLADPITIDPKAITNPHRVITGDGDIDASPLIVARDCVGMVIASSEGC